MSVVTIDETSELRYLRSARAVRERAAMILQLARMGRLAHWRLDETRLDAVAERVVRVTRRAYPDLRAIPYHSRWRHFGAGGVDRVRALNERLQDFSDDAKLATRVDLAITSVLLDAGAGKRWSYQGQDGRRYSRSEGLAVASFEAFIAGRFSSDPSRAPLRADAEALTKMDRSTLADIFQVDDDNPLIGLEGRVALLRQLGEVTESLAGASNAPHPGALPRLADFADRLRRQAKAGALRASALLVAILEDFAPIWPGRERLAGAPLGDVWSYDPLGRVPFHKLSQWLAYSLCEPLEWAGLRVERLDDLTGLAEYRNGGLFLDAGVVVPNDAALLLQEHDVSSNVVVEWRALTIALLDAVAVRVRRILNASPEELPLARILEGGTWAAGREIAAEQRADGSPPLRIASDGTVF